MRFYIASAFTNIAQVNELRDILVSAGWQQTHDWTDYEQGITDENVSLAVLRNVAVLDIMGVTSANVVIVLLPGGKGTHCELGAAIASSDSFGDVERIVVWAPDDDYFAAGVPAGKSSPFYHHVLLDQRRDATMADLASYILNPE